MLVTWVVKNKILLHRRLMF